MPFLISIIISFFFLIAPFGSHAGEVWEWQSLRSSETKMSQTNYINPCSEDVSATALTQLHHRSGSGTYYRLYPFTNFCNALTFGKRLEPIFNDKYFVHPYSYCKRLGLRLIFPEHYHW